MKHPAPCRDCLRTPMRLSTLHAALLAATLAPAATWAQDAKPEAGLEAVTVRARHADEAIRDVPFTVDVITGQALEERRLQTLEEALWQVPGVEINSYGNTNNTAVRIRGVGALQNVSGDDSSVSINIDGVAHSVGSVSALSFDVERVEVLKGPQGTLFGSNSEAGAINVITRKPTREFEGYARGELGQGHEHLLEGAVSGPISPTLAARLALRSSQYDNPVAHASTMKPLSQPRQGAVRGSLLWQPSGATRLTVTAQHEALDGYAGFMVLRPYGRRPHVDVPPGGEPDHRTSDRAVAELTHEMDAALFTSITGYNRAVGGTGESFYEGHLYRRLVGFAPDGYRQMRNTDEALSQELRLSSKPGASVFWLGGLSLRQSERSMESMRAHDNFFPANPFNADIHRRFKTTSQALFGEATWPVAQRLKLTAGLRHTWESKRYDATWAATPTNDSPLRNARDQHALKDNYTTGRLALNWAQSAQTNWYGVLARGYKAAGYNDNGSNIASGGRDLPYDAARVQSAELGFKYERADARAGLNGALFHSSNRGDHLLVFNTITYTANAENFDTRSQGAELSGYWKPGGGFTLTGGLALTDARISGIPASSTAGARVGNRVPDSPRWSTTLSLAHRMPLQSFLGLPSPVLNTLLTSRIVGDRAADPQNNFNLPRYHQLDLRAGVSSGNAEFYLWARNLLNQRHDLYGYYYAPFTPSGPDATIGAPSRGRALGVGMAYYF